MRRPRVGFAMEQTLGHVTYGMSLRRALAHRTDVEPVWIEVSFDRRGWGALPPLRNNWTLRGSAAARNRILAVHREQPLDALFLHTQTISLFAGGIMDRVPTLLSLDATPRNVDELAGSYGHSVGSRTVEHLKRRAHSHVMRKARHYTTWSAWAKKSLAADYGVPPDRVNVIHPGAWLASFPDREFWRRSPDVPLKILFVGGDFRRKGGDLLLSVFNAHLRDACELHLVTGADVPATNGVRVYHDMAPYSPELLRLYRECDVFVLPTRGDCMAVVLGEAMACALPIITTDVGGHAEAVEDGQSGFVIPVDDRDALRHRLELLAADPELTLRLGRRSRETGVARFDMMRNADAICNILVRLAGSGMQGRDAGQAPPGRARNGRAP